MAPCVRPGTGVPRSQAIELAKDEVQRTFHLDTNKLTLEHEGPLTIEGRHGNSFRWMKEDPSHIEHHYEVNVFDRPTLVTWSYTLPEQSQVNPDLPSLRHAIVVILLSALAFTLFLFRRLYSQVQPRVVGVLAVVSLLWAFGEATSQPISPVITFGLIFPLAAAAAIAWLIIVSAAVVSLMKRCWPHLAANYVRLIQLQPDRRATALALARGFGCGLILLGISSTFWQIGISTGLTWPRFDEYRELGSLLPILTSFGDAFHRALLPTFMLGLLTSLIRRWIAFLPLMCAIGGVLWTAQGEFSFLPRDWSLALFLFVQGTAFCWVMIKFDLLTLIATAFTFFLWWHGYPLAIMQQSLQGPECWLFLSIWGAVLAWSTFVGFLPLWRRFGTRLAEALD